MKLPVSFPNRSSLKLWLMKHAVHQGSNAGVHSPEIADRPPFGWTGGQIQFTGELGTAFHIGDRPWPRRYCYSASPGVLGGGNSGCTSPGFDVIPLWGSRIPCSCLFRRPSALI